jgi:CDP-glucose 4,6-dehydratase
MHFLITGHTGFKGAWLSLLLHERGHIVSGISLNPPPESLFVRAGVSKFLENNIECDIRDCEKLQIHFQSLEPDVVIHLAAQSLVRESYKDPLTTFQTNVNGTINVLNSSKSLGNLQAQLIITTDKVYKNVAKLNGYLEDDPLGGNDTYSASKAMADIATQSWIASFENAPTAIARAGNVVGGGDVCADRLIPDLVKSYSLGLTPKLRAPNSVRPWQHVLDCLNGYLTLVDAILEGKGSGPWNFGPDQTQIRTVADVSEIAGEIWGAKQSWEKDEHQHPHEASFLLLNSNKARFELGWKDKLSFEESIKWAMDWYKNVSEGKNPLDETMRNIRDFESR